MRPGEVGEGNERKVSEMSSNSGQGQRGRVVVEMREVSI